MSDNPLSQPLDIFYMHFMHTIPNILTINICVKKSRCPFFPRAFILPPSSILVLKGLNIRIWCKAPYLKDIGVCPLIQQSSVIQVNSSSSTYVLILTPNGLLCLQSLVLGDIPVDRVLD